MSQQDFDLAFGNTFGTAARFAQQAYELLNCAHAELCRPSYLFRPRLSIDGNQWCALYGDNLQDGVAGFGDSPSLAMEAFDKAWIETLSQGSLDSLTKFGRKVGA
jgi:hypothetical protein